MNDLRERLERHQQTTHYFTGRVYCRFIDCGADWPCDAAEALRLWGPVVEKAGNVDGLWFPRDDNWTGTDLTFWGPEAGEALRDLRAVLGEVDA